MMPPLIGTTARSVWNQRASLALTLLAIALSVLMRPVSSGALFGIRYRHPRMTYLPGLPMPAR
jgi:hypothetical protein